MYVMSSVVSVSTHNFARTGDALGVWCPRPRFTTPRGPHPWTTRGVVAQLVERALCMREVPRSKLGSSRTFFGRLL